MLRGFLQLCSIYCYKSGIMFHIV
uniref:Uncharacterized protein n=1 Tax=Arundo donax TaxID=35708 RepID=A0A0A8ZMS1_ARUDO